MRPLRAVTLPAVRDELSAQMLREVLVFAEHAAGDDRVDKVRTLWLRQANAMKTSSMWWVAPDMATLAADTGLSGDDMPEWVPNDETDRGLLVWDGGLPIRLQNRSNHGDVMVSVDAVSWAPIRDWSQDESMHGHRIEVWTRSTHPLVAGQHPKIPLSLVTIRFGDGDDSLVTVGDSQIAAEAAIWRVLSATMLLAHQPKVGTTRAANFRQDGSAKEKRTRDVPEVSVIDLRTVRDWAVDADGKAEGDGRQYSHRWIVRGHMRTYHVGPREGQRTEKRWIAPYVAGPEGAPLVPKEHVWVWRR